MLLGQRTLYKYTLRVSSSITQLILPVIRQCIFPTRHWTKVVAQCFCDRIRRLVIQPGTFRDGSTFCSAADSVLPCPGKNEQLEHLRRELTRIVECILVQLTSSCSPIPILLSSKVDWDCLIVIDPKPLRTSRLKNQWLSRRQANILVKVVNKNLHCAS